MSDDDPQPSALARTLRRYVPILDWLPTYQRDWLRPDVVAGITLAAYVLPVALAYASLAGLPPQAGLYSCMLAGLVFAQP